MEKLLLIQITPEDAILNLAQRMHIRTVSVSPSDYQKSIGQLAGFQTKQQLAPVMVQA